MNRLRVASVLALAAAIALPPARACAAPARIDLAVSIPAPSRGGSLQEDAVLRGIAEFTVRAWPALLEIRPGEAGDAAVRVTVTRDDRAVTVATELLAGAGPKRGLRSTIPPDSADAVAPTAAADIAWLWASASGFAGLEPGPAPELAVVLETESLAGLTGWPASGLEPLAMASSAEGLTVLFPRGWLTFGPLFRIGKETARDLLLLPPQDDPVYTGIARSARRPDRPLAGRRGDPPGRPAPRGPAAARRPGRRPAPRHRRARGGAALRFRGDLRAARGGGTEARSVRIGAAWTTASGADAHGNLWTWDGQERRIRVTTREGREIASLRPLVRAPDLPAPQAIAVFGDGSFLLGGSGELWRFGPSGIPAWRLSRLPGVPGGSLPASFALAVDRSSGAVWLLDGPSRRVLQFGGTGQAIGDGPDAEASRQLGALVQRLDERDADALARAGDLALAADMPLAAARFAARLARAGAPGADDLAAEAEVMVLRDHARAAAAAVADLATGLLAERALAACQRAVDLARAWRDRDPGDPEAGQLLEELTAKRRELREVATSKSDAPTLAAAARTAASGAQRPVNGGGTRTIVTRLLIRASAAADLAGLRVSFTFPGWTPLPAAVDVGALAAGGERTLEIELALGDVPDLLPPVLPAAAWLRWERGTEGRSAAIRLDAVVEGADAEGARR